MSPTLNHITPFPPITQSYPIILSHPTTNPTTPSPTLPWWREHLYSEEWGGSSLTRLEVPTKVSGEGSSSLCHWSPPSIWCSFTYQTDAGTDLETQEQVTCLPHIKSTRVIFMMLFYIYTIYKLCAVIFIENKLTKTTRRVNQNLCQREWFTPV